MPRADAVLPSSSPGGRRDCGVPGLGTGQRAVVEFLRIQVAGLPAGQFQRRRGRRQQPAGALFGL